MEKRYIENGHKKIPKLNLKSAQVFITRGAGLAPAGTLKSAPPGGSTVSGEGGEIKQNLLKQEFSSRDTIILSGSRVPAVLEMVKKKFGWQEGGKKSSADDRRRALHLAASYAPNSSGSLKEVGAALDYVISRLARECKQNNADASRGNQKPRLTYFELPCVA